MDFIIQSTDCANLKQHIYSAFSMHFFIFSFCQSHLKQHKAHCGHVYGWFLCVCVCVVVCRVGDQTIDCTSMNFTERLTNSRWPNVLRTHYN